MAQASPVSCSWSCVDPDPLCLLDSPICQGLSPFSWHPASAIWKRERHSGAPWHSLPNAPVVFMSVGHACSSLCSSLSCDIFSVPLCEGCCTARQDESSRCLQRRPSDSLHDDTNLFPFSLSGSETKLFAASVGQLRGFPWV